MGRNFYRRAEGETGEETCFFEPLSAIFCMKIIHEKKKCIGCGLCVTLCEAYWQMGEDGKSQLSNSKKNNDGNYELEIAEAGCNQEAVEGCPVQCIHIKN